MPGRREAVAEIVVAPIAERLVEKADLVQRARAIRGVPGADVIDFVAANATVSLLEIAAHHPGPEAGVRRRVVVALRGGYRRIVERLEQVREPTWRKDDVLIDLADDRISRFPHARVDGRGDAAAGAVDEP